MEKMIEICNSLDCTGCGLCKNVCPTQAINFMSDSLYGHMRPVINQQKCIGCKLCENKCPANNKIPLNKTIKTYAAWQINESKHITSSSGGIATVIYEKFIKDNEWIAGVYVSKTFEPKFKISNNLNDIELFKGSKYVQVNTGEIYNEVLKKLKERKKVVFIGLPCQCAALRNRVGDCDFLFLVDMVCHGVPSFKTLETHIKYLEHKKNKKIKNIRFRDNILGECLSLISKNGEVFYKRNFQEDAYMQSFMSGDLFAECCYRCKYACNERVGDMTICDFWGLGNKMPFHHKKNGVSAVMINTEKGQNLFDCIRSDLFYEERYTEEAIEGNLQLKHPSAKGNNREELLKSTINCDFENKLIEIYGKNVNKNYYKRKIIDNMKSVGKTMGLKKIYKFIKEEK